MVDKKQMYTRKEVEEIIYNVVESIWEDNLGFDFELWLNDQGKNWNWWANSHLFNTYLDEFVESFL